MLTPKSLRRQITTALNWHASKLKSVPFCPGNATHVSVGPVHLRRLLGGDTVHRADQSTVSAPANPGSRRGPHLPWTDLLLQALREARRALPGIRADILRVFSVLAYRWVETFISGRLNRNLLMGSSEISLISTFWRSHTTHTLTKLNIIWVF